MCFSASDCMPELSLTTLDAGVFEKSCKRKALPFHPIAHTLNFVLSSLKTSVHLCQILLVQRFSKS